MAALVPLNSEHPCQPGQALPIGTLSFLRGPVWIALVCAAQPAKSTSLCQLECLHLLTALLTFFSDILVSLARAFHSLLHLVTWQLASAAMLTSPPPESSH